MKVKLIIASIGIIGYLAYLKLSKYLKESNVQTFDYLRSDTGNSFFLGIDLTENPLLKMPILKWSIDKISLIVDDVKVAESLPVKNASNNFVQEFNVVPTANFTSLQAGVVEKNNLVEIKYKTIAGISITHRYKVNVDPTNAAFTEQNNTNAKGEKNTSDETVCEII